MKGVFVTFEGPEGGGKSTQIKRLAERLSAAGYDVVTTREPGGTPIGERVRDVLMSRESNAMTPETEALLMTAARAQHVHDVIAPALDRGAVVVCDRFVDSTLAYQGGGRGLALSALRAIQAFATRGIEPDLRVLLDLPVEIGLRRRLGDVTTSNRLDEEGVGFHQRVRASYLELAAADPDGWVVVDADGPLGAVTARVWNAVQPLVAAVPPVNEAAAVDLT